MSEFEEEIGHREVGIQRNWRNALFAYMVPIDLLQQIATIISTYQQIFTQMNVEAFLMVEGRRIEMIKKELIIVGALFWQRL